MYPLQEQRGGPARHKGRLPSRQTTKTSDLICLDVSRNCGRLMQARPFQCTGGKLLTWLFRGTPSLTESRSHYFGWKVPNLHNILVSITWQARDKDNCRRKPSVPVDQSRGSPGLLNAPRKGQGKTLNVNRWNKKMLFHEKETKKSSTFSLLHSLLWVIHLNIKCLPLQKEQLHSQEEYTQNAWSKYFSKLKSVSENILCCEAQQLGDYLSNLASRTTLHNLLLTSTMGSDAWTPVVDLWRLSLLGQCHHVITVQYDICSLCILWLDIIFLPALIYRYRALYILSLINVERKNILQEKWPIFFSLLSFGVEYMQHLVKLFAGGSPAIIHAVQAAPADGSISSIGMWAPSRPLNQPPPPPPKHHQRHNNQQHQHQQAGHSIEPVEPNSQLLPKICFASFPYVSHKGWAARKHLSTSLSSTTSITNLNIARGNELSFNDNREHLTEEKSIVHQKRHLARITEPSNNDYDNDVSDNCDHNFGTFDDFGVKNDQKVSHNMILMSKYKEQHGGK